VKRLPADDLLSGVGFNEVGRLVGNRRMSTNISWVCAHPASRVPARKRSNDYERRAEAAEDPALD